MAKNDGLIKWIIGGVLLIGGAMVVLPMITKPKAVAPIPAGVMNKPAQNFSVANAQYGSIPSVNFAGLALEQPTNAMPLGFGLTNIL
jgi:hypothetical protein